jgi:DNA-binding transcriptional LysR family regulator
MIGTKLGHEITAHLGSVGMGEVFQTTDLTRLHPLRTLDPPLEVPGFSLCQAWHEIHRADPAHRWLREMIGSTAAAVAA